MDTPPRSVLERARAAARHVLALDEVREGLDALAKEAGRRTLGAGPCPGDEDECHADEESHAVGTCPCGPDDERSHYPFPKWEGEHDFDGGECWRCQGVAPGMVLRPQMVTLGVTDVDAFMRFVLAAADIVEAAQAVTQAAAYREAAPEHAELWQRLDVALLALGDVAPATSKEPG